MTWGWAKLRSIVIIVKYARILNGYTCTCISLLKIHLSAS